MLAFDLRRSSVSAPPIANLIEPTLGWHINCSAFMKKFSERLEQSTGARAMWCFAAMMFLLATWTVGGRLIIEAKGTIVESQEGHGPRHSTLYKLKQVDGTYQTLLSGPTDASLPRDLPIGISIEKQRWRLGYSIDGNYRIGFPIGFYGSGILCSIVFFIIGLRFMYT